MNEEERNRCEGWVVRVSEEVGDKGKGKNETEWVIKDKQEINDVSTELNK